MCTNLVILVSGEGEKFPVDEGLFHKHCFYFKCLLRSEMKDSSSNILHFPALSTSSLNQVSLFFRYLYMERNNDEVFQTNQVENYLHFLSKFENKMEITSGLEGASFLQIDVMLSLYSEALIPTIKKETWQEVMSVSRKFNLPLLQEAVIRFICDKFEEVEVEWLERKEMKKILEKNEVSVSSEFNLFQIVIIYLKTKNEKEKEKNEQNEKWIENENKSLLKFVRYELMERGELWKVRVELGESFIPILSSSLSLQQSSYFTTSDLSPFQILEKINHILNEEEKEKAEEEEEEVDDNKSFPSHPFILFTTPRIRCPQTVVMAIGGFTLKEFCTKKVQTTTLNSLNDSLTLNQSLLFKEAAKCRLPVGLCEHSCCMLRGSLYVAGGQTRYTSAGRFTTNLLFRMDPLSLQWQQLKNMYVGRSLFHLSPLPLNNQIIAVSGNTSPDLDTDTVEVYDPFLNQWEFVAPLPMGVHEMAGCLHQNLLFISGGFRSPNIGHVDLVWQYNPVKNQWLKRAPMFTARSYHVMVSRGDKIFVVGGVKLLEDQSFIDIYDGEMYLPEVDQWTRVLKLDYPASCMSHLFLSSSSSSSCLYDNNLFLFGGHSFENENDHRFLQIVNLSSSRDVDYLEVEEDEEDEEVVVDDGDKDEVKFVKRVERRRKKGSVTSVKERKARFTNYPCQSLKFRSNNIHYFTTVLFKIKSNSF